MLRRAGVEQARQQICVLTLLQHILGHGAVGGPLATGDAHQARLADRHRVFAADAFGAGAIVMRRLDQRAQTDPDAAHIFAARRLLQILGRFIQDESHFRVKRLRLTRQVLARRVGGAQNHLAQPRHRKQNAAIGRLGHHQGVIGREERFVNHQVHTLAGCDDRPANAPAGLAVLAAQGIDPDTGGVDHARCVNLYLPTGFSVAALHAGNPAGFVNQSAGFAIINQQRTAGGRRARQHQRQTRIVKLAVPVFDAAAQVLRVGGRQQRAGLCAAQEFGGTEPGFASQRVVGLQADAIKRRFPPMVRRHHKGKRLRQMRRIGKQQGALLQGFAHQRNIALRKVAHTAMHQLGGA